MQTLILDIAILLGVATLAVGLWWWWPAASLCFVGAALLSAGLAARIVTTYLGSGRNADDS